MCVPAVTNIFRFDANMPQLIWFSNVGLACVEKKSYYHVRAGCYKHVSFRCEHNINHMISSVVLAFVNEKNKGAQRSPPRPRGRAGREARRGARGDGRAGSEGGEPVVCVVMLKATFIFMAFEDVVAALNHFDQFSLLVQLIDLFLDRDRFANA